ncbi:tetratricopeptide repeat protein [Planctomicrobium sp. SH664]|uniref:tetratricopeptide repeat protein n=1 Tax=Planctomicrobium sp. SH664 TaxID=3448125 RepID=UPI003F5BE6C0
MFRYTRFLLTLSTFSLAALPTTTHAQEVGETVVAVQDLALKVDDKGIGTIGRLELLAVEEIQGNQIRLSTPAIPNRAGLDGWAPRAAVVTLADALPLFTEEIKKNPTAYNYSVRGLIYNTTNEFDKAIADYTEAIKLEPKVAAFLHDRGFAWEQKRQYDKALADYEAAFRLDPQNPEPHNDAAWLWATCTDAKIRDGRKAVEHAGKACELTNHQDSNNLDTLAAAYAEVGDFANAVKWQTEALKLAEEETKADCQARLQLYQSGKPFRDTAR